MRRAGRNDDDVAFSEHARVAAVDGGSADLVGRDVLALDYGSPGDEFSFTVHDIDQVGVFGVDFSNARLFPPAGMDHEITSTTIEEHCALVEGSIHVASLEISHSAIRYGSSNRRVRRRSSSWLCGENVRSRYGQLFILLRTRSS